MASILDTISANASKPGRRVYKTERKTPPFQAMDLKEKLQTIAFDKRTQDRERRQRNNLTWYLMALYYRGYQQVSASASSIDVYEDQDYYIENQFRRYVDTDVQVLNKMEGDLIVRPASDSPKDLATARVGDPVLQMQRTDIGYEKLRDQKNLFKCLFGNAFIFTDFVRDKKYGSIVTPKFSYEEMPDPEADPMFGDPATILSKVVSGYDKKPKGKQVASVCSPLEINTTFDVYPFTEVPFLQWISRQDKEVMEYLYKDLLIEGGVSSNEIDLAQQYIETLQNLPGNILGDSIAYNRGSGTRQKCEYTRGWYLPCTFRNDKELLREFPDGVHVATVNGLVVDYYAENIFDRWTHEVLIPVPHSLLGDGLYDNVPVQDMKNETNSLFIQHLRYSTVGHKLYDSNVIDPKDIVNDPKNGWIPGKPSLDRSMRDAVHELPPTPLSGDVPAWLQHLDQAGQDMSSAYDSQAGKSLGANTPYSQSVFLAEKAQGRWKGSHDYNYPERIRFHVQLLEDARNNWIDMRQRAVVDNTGQWSFEQFSQADLQGDVDITFSDTDFKPRTRAEQVQGLTMLTTLLPLIPTLPPKQKLRIEEMMGLPPDANPMSGQISRAYRMIDRLKKGEEIAPLPLVDDPQQQIPVFMDFLASEDGEALGEAEPEIFAMIYSYMMTLMQFGMAQLSSPGGQLASQVSGKPQPQQGGAASSANPTEGKSPGGQPGQPGGGPGSMEQPEAQSPAKPAPPVAPPSPT